MADVHNKKIRSYNMSKIKAKDTKPELLVRKFLFSYGLRYRLHGKDLPGKPDLVFSKYKTVVFVHGCYWHGHEKCKYFSPPKTNTEWWMKKIGGNIARDNANLKKLKELGWEAIIIWECELKSKEREKNLLKLLKKIKNKR